VDRSSQKKPMNILVANLGSTSFKFRLFEMSDEQILAKGSIDRIGEDRSRCQLEIGSHKVDEERTIADHAEAVGYCFENLSHPETGCLNDTNDLRAIGFKAVFAGELSGVRFVDDELITKMEELQDVAPAHNPPYTKAMKQLRAAFPEIPLVAALETAFHETIPAEHRTYAIPWEWTEKYGVKRWGFHGASHRYIAERTPQLLKRNDARIISCHLGGSSSLCAIRNGKSVANSLGMSPQTGLPHNNRVGKFDPFALSYLMKKTGNSLEEILDKLATQSGLLGISGSSGDVRDLELAAENGDERAEVALKIFVASIREYLGSYLVQLDGLDALVFTGGIGENGKRIRSEVCRNLDWAGIAIDPQLNESANGESRISPEGNHTEVWVIPANEEIIVARQSVALLETKDFK